MVSWFATVVVSVDTSVIGDCFVGFVELEPGSVEVVEVTEEYFGFVFVGIMSGICSVFAEGVHVADHLPNKKVVKRRMGIRT